MNIKTELVTMIEYLVDSIFVQVGKMVFRQCVGIPTDCAPLLANLYYEYNFIRLNTSNTARYIHVDDLLTLNTPSLEAYTHVN